MLRKLFIGALLFVICVVPLGLITSVPRTDRTYVAEQEVLPAVRIAGGEARVRGVRAFRYGEDGSSTPYYQDRSYDLGAVRRVWFGLSPFGAWRGPAHAFLSFEFADSQFLAVSVEARREVGEEYSPWLGMLRGYELMYVVGAESDVIGRRAAVDRDPVYLYPGRAAPAQAARLLEVLLHRAGELRARPEYYQTLTNNCATNLATAINEIAPGRVPWNRALVLPGFSDEFAWELGLLDLPASPERVRERYRVDGAALLALAGSDFSAAIRRGLPQPE